MIHRRGLRFGLLAAALAATVLSLPALGAVPQSSTTPTVAAKVSTADTDLEVFLSEGRVLEAQLIGTGITRPMKLELEYQGRSLKAAFKTVNILRRERHKAPGFPVSFEFTDRYQYERAAYLLDRALDLGMVPVAIVRTWEGHKGAAIVWIEDALTENQRRDQGLEPPDPMILSAQRHVMKIFDALVLNTDRTLDNQLVTPADWKLYLIDHSRAFRRSHELPEIFEVRPVRLPRSLLPRLEALDIEDLRPLLREVLSSARIRAVMARRDRILAKIERDRQTYGDEAVFLPELGSWSR